MASVESSDDESDNIMLSEVEVDSESSSSQSVVEVESSQSSSDGEEEKKKESSPPLHRLSGHSSAGQSPLYKLSASGHSSSAYSSSSASSSSSAAAETSISSINESAHHHDLSKESGHSAASSAYSSDPEKSKSTHNSKSKSTHSSNHSSKKNHYLNNESAHSAMSKASITGKVNMPPWLIMPTAVTGGGVKLGPFASPSMNSESTDNNSKGGVLKVQLRHIHNNHSKSLDISNHPPETEEPPKSPKSKDATTAKLLAILVYRLSSAKETSNKPPLCLAKLDLTTPPLPPKGDTPPTPPQRKSGVKAKKGNDDSVTIDHTTISTIIHNSPPNHSTGIMQKRLKNFVTVEYYGGGGNNNDVATTLLCYGSEITSKSTRPLCVAAVYSGGGDELLQQQQQELLQLVYHKFTKQHGSFLVQNAKTELQLQEKSMDLLKEVAEKYDHHQGKKSKAASTINPLLQQKNANVAHAKPLLGRMPKNNDSKQQHADDKDDDDDERRLLNNLQLMVSSSQHSTTSSSSHIVEKSPKAAAVRKSSPVKNGNSNSKPAPWANQRLRKTGSKIVMEPQSDDDEDEDEEFASEKIAVEDASKAKVVHSSKHDKTPSWAKQKLRSTGSKKVKNTTDESEEDVKNVNSKDDINNDTDEEKEEQGSAANKDSVTENGEAASESRPGFWTKMASLRSVKKDTPTITTVSETTATYTAKTITVTTDKDPVLTTPRSILLEDSKNSSIQSTLGGSVVNDEEDITEMDDETEPKESPVWAKAKSSLRPAPALKKPEKKPSLPPATKDDLRPTPQPAMSNQSLDTLPFSPTRLRSIEPSDSKQGQAAEKDAAKNTKQDDAAKNPITDEKQKEISAPPPPPTSSPAMMRARAHHPWNKDEIAKAKNRKAAEPIAMSDKPRPLEAEETLRKPTLSGYDNWGLVKSHHLPSTSIHVNENDDASTISHSLTADGESASGASDWGVPTQYQNADDSSWVNPARPMDPKRKDKVKREVDKLFLKHLEQTRMKSLSETPLFESKQESDAIAAEDEESNAGKPSAFLLAAKIMTQPGSFDEEKGWSMPSDTTALEIARRNKQQHPDPPSIQEEKPWAMPRQAMGDGVVYQKMELEQKDYRYTYITARPAFADGKGSNDAPTKSSYWDKVRQNYFDGGNVPLPTDGAAHATTIGDNTYRPTWKSKAGSADDDDDDTQTNDSEWLPPDYSSNPTYRAIAAKARALESVKEPVQGVSRDIAPDAASKSLVSSKDSDWEPPSTTSQVRHIDFAGRVMYQNESDSSDAIPWVPKPEDLVFESSLEEEEYEALNDSQDQLHKSFAEDSMSNYSEDNANWSVYSSALKFDDEEDDDFKENPTFHASNLSDDAIAIVNQQLQDMEEGSSGRAPIRHPSVSILKDSRGSSQESSSASIDASIDSVLSYTGRISFCIEPELITFEDDPNEERGTHYIQRKPSKDRDEKYTSRSRHSSNGPDPCVYYSLCCIMIAIPAVVLTIMFVFVIDVNGDGDSGN